MDDSFSGKKPLDGSSNSSWDMDKMRCECIGAKLVKLSQSGWGQHSFSCLTFDNGYVVITNEDDLGIVYDNKHKIDFYLYCIIRKDNYHLYFIDEKNADKYLKIAKAKEEGEERVYLYFENSVVKKCDLSMTAYELAKLDIKDNHYLQIKEKWTDYLTHRREHPSKYEHYIND